MSVISASAECCRSTSAARIPAGPAPMMRRRVMVGVVAGSTGCVLRQAQDEVDRSLPSTTDAGTPTSLILSLSKDAPSACSAISMQMHILVIDRQIVDAAIRRCDPGRHLAGGGDALHQALDEIAVAFRRDPARKLRLILRARDEIAPDIDALAGPGADRTAEARARQRQLHGIARLGDEAVPAFDADLAVADIGLPRRLVHGVPERHLLARDAALAVG